MLFLAVSTNGFSAHCNLILVLEIGFWRLENALYCIVNDCVNAMKETERVVKLEVKLVFPVRVSIVNLCVLCVSAIVYFLFCLRICMHCYT